MKNNKNVFFFFGGERIEVLKNKIKYHLGHGKYGNFKTQKRTLVYEKKIDFFFFWPNLEADPRL
jgi:hypothetical protein